MPLLKQSAACLPAFILFFTTATAQQEKDPGHYAQSFNLDSAITPDHFRAEISIGEYYYTAREGRKYNSTFVSLDSVTRLFMAALQQLGFRQTPELVTIKERMSESYQRKKLLQATYNFRIASQDSISILYRGLVKNMPEFSLTRIRIVPQVSEEREALIKKEMEARALARMKAEARVYADANHFTIDRIETYSINFRLENKDDPDSFQNQNTAYLIDYAPPVARLNTFYSFRMK